MRVLFAGAILFVVTGCSDGPSDERPEFGAYTFDGDLVLPDGFESLVVADSTGRARHIAVDDNSDIYVQLRFNESGEGVNVALRDTSGDGRADIIRNWGDYQAEGSLAAGMRIHDGYIYYSSIRHVFRNRFYPDELVPSSRRKLVLTDDHEHGVGHWHIAKPFAFDGRGNIYVPFGVPSNNCQEIRVSSLASTPGAAGLDPCPELEDHGGIWKFDLSKSNQTQSDGTRYGTGIRSAVALAWNPSDDNLYTVIHGRDNLHVLFPEHFTAWDNAVLPSEEFVRVTKNTDVGWPYCYHDPDQNRKVLAPEYGGDGQKVGQCDEFDEPLIGFPAHYAPNDLLFYQGDQFPERYRDGAFIAFHGSNNRTPFPQAGYIVAFVPFENGEPGGEWEVFADGFVGVDPVETPRDAIYRPMGLAEGPDGSLYVSESQQGKIWRIMFAGDRESFGSDALVQMESRKEMTHLAEPARTGDNLDLQRNVSRGEMIYNTNCRSCHGQDGFGSEAHFPALAGSELVTGNHRSLIRVTLNGLEGMPPFEFMEDEELAEVLTYVRQSFGNNAGKVEPAEVKELR